MYGVHYFRCANVLCCRRYHGKTMIATLLHSSSCGGKPLGEIEEASMADFIDGVAWAILGCHNISAQGRRKLHVCFKWREELLGINQQNSPFSPITWHKTEGNIFIWMIAWVRGSLVGLYFPMHVITPTLKRP